MKLETAIVIAKGTCVSGSATLLALSSGLSQWSNETANPSVIQWIMIAGGSIGAGLSAAGAFLSGSFGNYLKARNGIDITNNQSAIQTLQTK
jgi:hypothetical protein